MRLGSDSGYACRWRRPVAWRRPPPSVIRRSHFAQGSLNSNTTLSSPATSSAIPHGPVSVDSKTALRLVNALFVVHTQNVLAMTLAAVNPDTTATMFTSAIPAAMNKLFVGSGVREYANTAGATYLR